jgi:uncharacterized protein (UPF0335 family)
MENEIFEQAIKLREAINVLREYVSKLSRNEYEWNGKEQKVTDIPKKLVSVDLHFQGKTQYACTISPETMDVLPIDDKARILLNTTIEVFWVNFIEILIAEIYRLEEEFKSLKP